MSERPTTRARREFRWAVDVEVPPPGAESCRDLEADGWKRVGSHPLYEGSHLMERTITDDEAPSEPAPAGSGSR